MSFLVVAVHVGYVFPSAGEVIDVLGHASVPVFFVISGFFFGKSYFSNPVNERGKLFSRYVKRIFVLYLIWTLVYCPIAFLYLLNHHSFSVALLFYIRNIVFVGQNMMSWHLWYLHAMMIALLLIHGLYLCKLKSWVIFALCFLLYGLGVYIDSVDNSFTQTYKFLLCDTQNGLFRGSIYMWLGMLLSKHRDAKSWIFGFCLLLSYNMFIFDIPLFYPLFSFGFVGVIYRIPKQDLVPLSLANWCRKTSTFIYLFHFLPIVFMQQILHWQGDFMLSYGIVISVCLASAWIWIRLSKVDKLSVMKKFY